MVQARLTSSVCYAMRNIVLNPDEIGQAILVTANRRNGELVPEHRTIFTVVPQPHPARTVVDNRLPYLLACLLIAVVALQKPTVPVENFFLGVARQAFESLVGVDENGVISLLLGDHQAVIGGVDRLFQQ